MDRREFIKKTSKAMALAAITGGTGAFFHNREIMHYESFLSKSTDFVVPFDNSLPGIALSKNSNHIAALNASLDAIGGIKRFIQKGNKVTIKPNVGWDRAPAQAANTNPDLVGEMVRLCYAGGASEVIVTDISCNDPRRCFLRSGIRESSEKSGAKVILPTEADFIKTDIKGKILDVWPVLKPFIETDRLINMPIVKQHSLSSCTIGMKNFYGILGGERHRLHQDIDQSIVDLAAFCRPTLVVIDATHVLLRGGPQGGSLDDVLTADSVICSTDQVAADSRAAEFLGLKGENIGHIMLAEKSELGKIDYKSIGYKEIV
jgi:uncharacterized protein (DUF362 family)